MKNRFLIGALIASLVGNLFLTLQHFQVNQEKEEAFHGMIQMHGYELAKVIREDREFDEETAAKLESLLRSLEIITAYQDNRFAQQVGASISDFRYVLLTEELGQLSPTEKAVISKLLTERFEQKERVEQLPFELPYLNKK